jgi:three-Cys-motif partner protein
MTTHPIASDGLPARASQPYAQEKLRLAGHYQRIFAVGMKRWPQLIYLDLLAGSGRCVIEETGEEFPGSPVLSLEAPFTRRVFVEADPLLAAALRQRVPSTCLVLTADCNAPATITALRSHVPARGALGLAFIDNLGLDVTMATLRELTADRKIDLMIVFQLQALTRNISEVLAGRQPRQWVDAFFGDDLWEQRAQSARAENASDGEIAEALLQAYKDRLKAIGYGWVGEARRPMTNSRNAPQYRVILASKDALALTFFEKIQQIDLHGQRSLL